MGSGLTYYPGGYHQPFYSLWKSKSVHSDPTYQLNSQWRRSCGCHMIYQLLGGSPKASMIDKTERAGDGHWFIHTLPHNSPPCGVKQALEIIWCRMPELVSLKPAHTLMQFPDMAPSASRSCPEVHLSVWGRVYGNDMIQKVLARGSLTHKSAKTHSQKASSRGQIFHRPKLCFTSTGNLRQ
jgi:hypothetical protein